MVSVPDGARGDDILKVLHAPGYAPRVGPASVRAAEDNHPDTIGWSEAYKAAGWLNQRPLYRAVVGRSKVNTRKVTSTRGDAGDNPISVRDDHHISDRRSYRVTHPGPLPVRKWAPERWVTVAVFEWNGEWVTHINVHPSPPFTGLLKWRKVMNAALREVRMAKAAGRLVVLTGDLQTRSAGAKLIRVGLKVWREGIDYVAYSPRFQRQVDGSRTFKPEGMDHPWMLAALRLVR